MIIINTLGGTLYQDNNKTKMVWLCKTTNREIAVWDDANKEKTRKTYVDRNEALSYASYLVDGE